RASKKPRTAVLSMYDGSPKNILTGGSSKHAAISDHYLNRIMSCVSCSTTKPGGVATKGTKGTKDEIISCLLCLLWLFPFCWRNQVKINEHGFVVGPFRFIGPRVD